MLDMLKMKKTNIYAIQFAKHLAQTAIVQHQIVVHAILGLLKVPPASTFVTQFVQHLINMVNVHRLKRKHLIISMSIICFFTFRQSSKIPPVAVVLIGSTTAIILFGVIIYVVFVVRRRRFTHQHPACDTDVRLYTRI